MVAAGQAGAVSVRHRDSRFLTQESQQLPGRSSTAVVMPLSDLTSQAAKCLELRGRLHSLSHSVEAERVGNRDDRTDQGHRLLVLIERAHERLVDFYNVDGKGSEIGQ